MFILLPSSSLCATPILLYNMKCPFLNYSSTRTMDFPVFTFSSGATNSMRGAMWLSGLKNAVVADIGGTSTDVGVLKDGFPREASTLREVCHISVVVYVCVKLYVYVLCVLTYILCVRLHSCLHVFSLHIMLFYYIHLFTCMCSNYLTS